jgi:hypothetical protein
VTVSAILQSTIATVRRRESFVDRCFDSTTKVVCMTLASRGHFAKTGMYYTHGFLGASAMEAYLGLARHRLGLSATVTALPPDPPATFCSAWGGFGSQLILSQLVTGGVSERLWKRFSRAVARTKHGDFYRGTDGALPVLAVLAGTPSASVARLARLAYRRSARRLRTSLDQYDRGTPVNVGLAHGVAGTLLAYEIACALLQIDGTAYRHRAIAQLSACAVSTQIGEIWPDWTHSTTRRTHGLCNGTPSVCLTALLGYRYSGDDAYVPLIEQSIATVPLHTAAESLCCGTLGRVEVLIEAYRTSNDENFLDLARELFTRVEPSRLSGKDWKEGPLAHQFTVLRLSAPTEVDLPGLPMKVQPLAV